MEKMTRRVIVRADGLTDAEWAEIAEKYQPGTPIISAAAFAHVCSALHGKATPEYMYGAEYVEYGRRMDAAIAESGQVVK